MEPGSDEKSPLKRSPYCPPDFPGQGARDGVLDTVGPGVKGTAANLVPIPDGTNPGPLRQPVPELQKGKGLPGRDHFCLRCLFKNERDSSRVIVMAMCAEDRSQPGESLVQERTLREQQASGCGEPPAGINQDRSTAVIQQTGAGPDGLKPSKRMNNKPFRHRCARIRLLRGPYRQAGPQSG